MTVEELLALSDADLLDLGLGDLADAALEGEPPTPRTRELRAALMTGIGIDRVAALVAVILDAHPELLPVATIASAKATRECVSQAKDALAERPKNALDDALDELLRKSGIR